MFGTPWRRIALLVAFWPAAACMHARVLGTVERLFVFDVGECHTTDVANWSPGVDAGKPWVFANHCYLIQHQNGLLLWDSGFPDQLVDLADGLTLGDGTIRIRVTRPLAAQLRALGVSPADVTHLAFSHLHMDHAGNANLFATAILHLQDLEHAAAFGPTPERFGFRPDDYTNLRASRKVLLHGDHDVFGDGSVVILSTPGHTPGHQSLLVRLRRTGNLLLSGDVAHFRSNWEHRRTPASNFDRAQSVRSMLRIEQLLLAHDATLVIHHDAGQSAMLPKAPAFLD